MELAQGFPLNTKCRNTNWITRTLLGLVMMVIWVSAGALTLTPTQIQAFMNLPKDQQEQIAKQYGVDLSQYQNSPTPKTLPQEPLPTPIVPNQQNQSSINSNGDNSSQQLQLQLQPGINNQGDKSQSGNGAQFETSKVELKPFGYDLFQNNSNMFQPNVDIPVPADYVIGPGDTFVVQLYGKDNNTYSLQVSREGVIQFPELGPISLAGLTFSQAQNVISRAISEQMIGVKSSITMGALRTIRIFVLGEAVNPGSYVVGSLSTITNALFASGGITKIGSLRNVELKRRGKVITTLDLYDLLLRGDTRNDARLLPGDVIFIPPVGTVVGIDGQVRRPALYEIKGKANAGDIIKLAGGLLPTAYPRASRIERINVAGERTVVDVDLASLSGLAQLVKVGDTIHVYSVLDTKENIVTVDGYVKRPGIAAWKSGVRVSQVVGGVDALMPNPDLNAAIIEREVQPARQIKVLLFNPDKALSHPGSADDLVLQPRDKIIFFDLQTDRSKSLEDLIATLRMQASREHMEKTVTIEGSVRFPGVYPLTDGMTARELIALAGGLSQNAYDLDAEITRYGLDKSQQQQISYINVKLSSSKQYVLKESDRLNVRRLPDWSPEQTIELSGEIMFPGKYTIRQGETLSEVIARAGGLTDQAYPQAAVFTRQELQQLEQQRLTELKSRLEADIAASNAEQQSSTQKIGTQDAQQLLKNVSSVKPLGRMVIDLAAIIKHDPQQDVRIVDGDKLYVPRFKQAVTVVGEVQYPTSHLYQKNLSVEDYIDRSGGLNARADKNRIYVVKANGMVYLPNSSSWFSRDDVDVQPGDTVVVPLDADRIKSLTLWTSVSQIFYQVALGAAAVASF